MTDEPSSRQPAAASNPQSRDHQPQDPAPQGGPFGPPKEAAPEGDRVGETDRGENVLVGSASASRRSGDSRSGDNRLIEKGSMRSMWELLMQLRILLPYLTRLIPLIDKGLLKGPPDLTDLRKEVAEISSANRDAAKRAQDGNVRLLKIEEQIVRVRKASEEAEERIGEVAKILEAQKRWMRFQTGVNVAILGLLVAILCLILR